MFKWKIFSLSIKCVVFSNIVCVISAFSIPNCESIKPNRIEFQMKKREKNMWKSTHVFTYARAQNIKLTNENSFIFGLSFSVFLFLLVFRMESALPLPFDVQDNTRHKLLYGCSPKYFIYAMVFGMRVLYNGVTVTVNVINTCNDTNRPNVILNAPCSFENRTKPPIRFKYGK